jgi:hypothetical protein
MQIAVLALLLAAVFGLLSPSAQNRLRAVLHGRPLTIWIIPFLLTGIFAGAAAMAKALSFSLVGVVLAYTLAATACAYVQGAGSPKRPGMLDFLAIVLL